MNVTFVTTKELYEKYCYDYFSISIFNWWFVVWMWYKIMFYEVYALHKAIINCDKVCFA